MHRNFAEKKTDAAIKGGTNPGAKPGDYELGSLESRAAARALLDRKLTGEQQKRFRLVVEHIGRNGLDNTTCTRSLWPDGTVSEIVHFGGYQESMTTAGCPESMTTAQWEEQLEQLIRKVPIDGKTYRLVCSKNLVELTDRK